jgi:hypothetical protein
MQEMWHSQVGQKDICEPKHNLAPNICGLRAKQLGQNTKSLFLILTALYLITITQYTRHTQFIECVVIMQ